MTAIILLVILGIWIAAATILVVTASMMSARISRIEEGSAPSSGTDSEIAPLLPLAQGGRIPTQPRASTAN